VRIAYITETYPPELNGVSLTVARSVAFLREAGHDVELIRPRQPHEAARNDATEWLTGGLAIPVYPDLRMGFMGQRRIVARWQDRRPDLVHVATPGPLGWSAAASARRLGIAATSDFRTNFQQYGKFYGIGLFEPLVRWQLRRFHNLTGMTFVPTQAMQREFTAQGFERLSVVGRGVDAQRFSPERRSAALRRQWGAAGDAPVVLHVGRLAREKNVQLAIRGFEAVLAARPDARMVVVGDGPMKKKLVAAHPGIVFAGVQSGEALAAHYASADIFLFPSMTDTFGNVTLEALASGLAVVAFDTAAAGEHIVNGKSGFAVPMGDEPAFLSAATALASRLADFAPMRLAAREVAQRTTWDAVLRGFEHHLRETAHAGNPKTAGVKIAAV
jgi:glycosyltransferase involved in cell wall biosynthesis